MLFNPKKVSILCLFGVSFAIMGINGLAFTTSCVGCFGDAADRAMKSLERQSASNIHGWTIEEGKFADIRVSPVPVETCAHICSTFRLPYFAMQASFACFCSGDEYNRYGPLPESSCNWNCQGNPSVRCGGGYANSVYKINYSSNKDNAVFVIDNYAKSLGWIGMEANETKIDNVFNLRACAFECSKLGSGCASFKYNATQSFCYVNKYMAVSNTMDVFAKH